MSDVDKVDPEALRAVYLEAVRELQPLNVDDLDAEVAERLGVDLEDIEESRASDELLTDGTLEILAGDWVVEQASFISGITLTHRLSESEIEADALDATFDLSPFRAFGALAVEGSDHVVVSMAIAGDSFFEGPEGWLKTFTPGDLLLLRATTNDLSEIGVLEIDKIEPLSIDDDGDLVELLRSVYELAVEEPDLPVSADDLVLGMLIENREAFATPHVPLEELVAAVGLERRGNNVAHDPRLWENERQVRRLWRLLSLPDSADYKLVMSALTMIEDESSPAEEVRKGLASIHDVERFDAAAAELLRVESGSDLSKDQRQIVERACSVAQKPNERAVARTLAAMVAEGDRELAVAEAHLALAVESESDWPIAVDRLAWYRADRGDAVGAAQLWRRIGETAATNRDLREVEQFTRPAAPSLGRNDPCWCGSGRKFKQCHWGEPAQVALPDRVGWICRKAVSYLERSGDEARQLVFEMAQLRAVDPEDQDSLEEALSDPIVLDVVLTELGWFERFVADRGSLLPDDEALLATSWLLVERTIYEILEVEPGASVTVRDLRTGDRELVREQTFSRQARVGMLICARAVPDGEGRQFVGGMFLVKPGREGDLLEVLDEGSAEGILEFVAGMLSPPTLVNRENETLLSCELEIEVPDAARAKKFLDKTYEIEPDRWVDLYELNEDEYLLRASLTLDGDRLHVSANSEERIERVLRVILKNLPSAKVISDERTEVDVSKMSASSGLTNAGSPSGLNAVDPAVLEQVRETMERRWLDENIPALHGLTPREAAADPTRRDELRRLIDSFEPLTAHPNAMGFRPEKLKQMLGF